MQLTIPEEFILLALNTKKGKFMIDSLSLNYGLAGAILLELSGQERFNIQNKRLKIQNSDKDKNPLLEMGLVIMRKAKKEYKAKQWIMKLGRSASKFKRQVIADLIDKRILKKEKKLFLGLIPYYRYPEINPKPENELRERIYEIVLYHKKPTVRCAMLLSLVENCKLTRVLFKRKHDAKLARKRIKELSKEIELADDISKAVNEVRAAIVAATAATVVTGSTAS